MLALGYLALSVAFGDVVARHFVRPAGLTHRLAAAVLVGILLSTWLLFVAAFAFASGSEPMLAGNLVAASVMAVTVLASATVGLRRGRRRLTGLQRPARSDLMDWAVIAGCGLLVAWMMNSSFRFAGGELLIGLHSWGDIAVNMALGQSFALGHNYPPEHSLFAAAPIATHFLFYFQVGNLTYLGLDPALASNVLSVISLTAMLALVIVFGRRVFGSAAAGRIGALLFFFHGSLSFLLWLATFGSPTEAVEAISRLDHFVPTGFPYRDEHWATWTQNVFVSQRHLPFAMGVFLLALIFVAERVALVGVKPFRPRQAMSDARAVAGDMMSRPTAALNRVVNTPGLAAFVAVGAMLGLLPLWNTAVFVAAAVVFACCLLLLANRVQTVALGLVAAGLAIPQVLWLRQSYAPDVDFELIQWGYLVDPPTVPAVAAYVAVIFGPKLLLVGLAVAVSSPLQRRLLLAVSSLVAVAFFTRLSTDMLNNHKFLNTWLVVANVYAAYGLLWLLAGQARWQGRLSTVAVRVTAVVMAGLILAGGVIDLVPIDKDPPLAYRLGGNTLYEWVRDETEPEAVFLSDVYVLHPILLAGRRLYYGWPVYPWSHGYDVTTREASYRRLLAGRSPRGVVRELQTAGIDYVAFDDGLRMGTFVEQPNEALFAEHLELVYRAPDGEQANIAIYRVPTAPDAWRALPDAEPLDMWTGGEGDGEGEFRRPRGIAVGPDGAVYVADSGNHRLQRFAADGSFAAAIGSGGSAAGEFDEPNGLAVDEAGRLFVADTANHRLQQLDSAGRPIDEWRGPEPGFYGPRDVALGNDGMVWILDQGRARVVGRAPDGTVITFGSLGDGPAELNDPTGLAVAGGLVYVADPTNRRIQVFTTSGDFLQSLAVPEWGTPFDYPDVAVDIERGLLYASQPAAGAVLVLDLDGERLTTLGAADGQELRAPSALAVAPDGRLLVVDYGASRVVALEPPVGLR